MTEIITWEQARQISDIPSVCEYVVNLEQDQTEDNAVCLIQEVVNQYLEIIGYRYRFKFVMNGEDFYTGWTTIDKLELIQPIIDEYKEAGIEDTIQYEPIYAAKIK